MANEGDSGQEAKILLVDDDESVRKILGNVLEVSGFHVTTAASVDDALYSIDTERFDVLLCDMHLPSTEDGFTVLGAMRYTHPDSVTLVFTCKFDMEQTMDAILLQDEILLKPMPIPTLLGTLREKLEKRGMRMVA